MPQRAPTFSLYDRRVRVNRQAKARQDARLFATNSRQWLRIRDMVLSMEPLCRSCMKAGKLTPANEVDHIDGDSANNSIENLQPLCKPCHSEKTAKEHGFECSN